MQFIVHQKSKILKQISQSFQPTSFIGLIFLNQGRGSNDSIFFLLHLIEKPHQVLAGHEPFWVRVHLEDAVYFPPLCQYLVKFLYLIILQSLCLGLVTVL